MDLQISTTTPGRRLLSQMKGSTNNACDRIVITLRFTRTTRGPTTRVQIRPPCLPDDAALTKVAGRLDISAVDGLTGRRVFDRRRQAPFEAITLTISPPACVADAESLGEANVAPGFPLGCVHGSQEAGVLDDYHLDVLLVICIVAMPYPRRRIHVVACAPRYALIANLRPARAMSHEVN